MNRVTITINFTDDVLFEAKDIHCLLDMINEDLLKFGIHKKCISDVTAFQETKKHYHH